MATEVQDYEVAERLQVARDAAERAGKVTLKFFQTDFERQTKADGTVVTIADRKSEQHECNDVRAPGAIRRNPPPRCGNHRGREEPALLACFETHVKAITPKFG